MKHKASLPFSQFRATQGEDRQTRGRILEKSNKNSVTDRNEDLVGAHGDEEGGLLPSDTVVLVQYFVTVSSADGGRQFGKLVRWGDGCNNDGRSGKNDCFLKKREVPNYFVTVLVRDAQNV